MSDEEQDVRAAVSMSEYIADAAVAKGRVVTIAAGRGVYVFMHKP